MLFNIFQLLESMGITDNLLCLISAKWLNSFDFLMSSRVIGDDNLSLNYTIQEVGTTFHITVKSDYLEDHFNKITLGYTGQSLQTLDFNTRNGLPFISDPYMATY